MNFQASVLAMSAAFAAVPASLGGMNIPHGLESAPVETFWTITGAILIGSSATWYAYMRKFKKAGEMTANNASELVSLQYILGNMDSLDNAFDASHRAGSGKPMVTREALREAMRQQTTENGARLPSEDEVYDLLFRVFDTDQSHGIEMQEWRKR
jgi:hypothetical protein